MTLATVLAVAAASLVTGAAASAKGYTTGDPQPELAPFNVGTEGGGAGSGAVLADGTSVLVSLAKSGASAVVCTIHPGERGCASTTSLSAYALGGARDSFSGVPEVVATGGSDVTVVIEDCCRVPVFAGLGGAVVFDSSNDGATFSAETPAGTVQGVDAATYAGGHVVVASSETTSLNVQAFQPDPAAPVTTVPANPNRRRDGDTSVTTYKGGVLLASDDANGNTLVEYAPSGSNFNLSSSYGSPLGPFDGEDLAGVSGNALLTYSSTSTPGAFIRFFNGKSFGPRHRVPEPTVGGDDYWSIRETGSAAHVFFVDRSDSSEVYSETTDNGAVWSPLTAYGAAVTAGGLVPVLYASGAGLVFETEVSRPPLFAQPVLSYQPVVIALARERAPVGRRTYLTGQASPHLKGQTVTLQRRISTGVWASVYVTHESSAGRFVFSVAGTTETYRVVVAYVPGYYLYGYSNAVTLTAVPKTPPKP